MASTPEKSARRVLVSGQVQGVFFRDSCARLARAEGVAGWVKNRADGRVEVFLEGSSQAVEKLVAWCREGPRHAEVTDVEVTTERPTGLEGFRIQ